MLQFLPLADLQAAGTVSLLRACRIRSPCLVRSPPTTARVCKRWAQCVRQRHAVWKRRYLTLAVRLSSRTPTPTAAALPSLRLATNLATHRNALQRTQLTGAPQPPAEARVPPPRVCHVSIVREVGGEGWLLRSSLNTAASRISVRCSSMAATCRATTLPEARTSTRCAAICGRLIW